jgi:hypothetical protein
MVVSSTTGNTRDAAGHRGLEHPDYEDDDLG